MAVPPRRLVTGLDTEGRSFIIIDGPAPRVIWESPDAIADNSGTLDRGGGALSFPDSGSHFTFHDFSPSPDGQPHMHATDTIDYVVVLTGEVTLITETDRTIVRAGDVVVDRGVIHGWHAHSTEPCRIFGVGLAALAVGKGGTVRGEAPK